MTLPPQAGEVTIALIISAIILVVIMMGQYFGLFHSLSGIGDIAGRHKAW